MVQRVFLVGCPRSGTTLLQSHVAAHPAIASFPESHFFTHTISWRAWRRAFGLASPRAGRRLREYVAELGVAAEARMPPRWWPFERTWVRAFGRIMDSAAERRGRSVWVEKTPDHVFFIDSIEEHLAPVRIVHLLRRGADVIASLYDVTQRFPQRWSGALSLDACIEKWTAAARISIRMAGQDGHHLVSYESLVAEPVPVLEGICAFLDVPFSQQMIEHRASAARSLIGDEPWKDAVRSPVRAPASRFDRVFSTAQQEYVNARIEGLQAEALSAIRRQAHR